MPYKRFLGYEKGENGPVVNKDQAEIVRLIYRFFLDGMTPVSIAKELTVRGIPTPGGKEHWCTKTVFSILTNLKYTGSAILQKNFTVDFLTKKQKINEGEVPQYYVEGSHEGIIPRQTFDLVQAEIEWRRSLGNRYSGKNVFSSRLVCADCGCFYGQKVWHSNNQYRRVIYQCNGKYLNKKRCTTPAIEEQDVKDMFLKAFNRLVGQRERVLEDTRLIYETLTDHTELDREIADANQELTVIAGMIDACVKENAIRAQSQEEYEKRYSSLEKGYKAAEKIASDLQAERHRIEQRELDLRVFLLELEQRNNFQKTWDNELWLTSVRQGTVFPDGSIEFEFKNGQKIKVEEE